MKMLNLKSQLLIWNFAFLTIFLPATFNFELLTLNYNVAHAGFIVNRPFYAGLDSGLVGYWSFEAADMSGTTAYDRSGQGNNGTLTNGPVRAAGKIGQGMSFDLTNDLVDVANESNFDFERTNTFSIGVWVKRSTIAATTEILAKASNAASDQGYRLELRTNGLIIVMLNNDVTTLNYIEKRGTTNIADNTWHQVTITYDGSSVAAGVLIYIDGKLEVTSTVQDSLSASILNNFNLYIGNDSYITTGFGGFIDDVRIYNRTLSADEVKRLYKMGATTKIGVSRKDTLTDGLVGYWTFDGPDMAGTTAYDRSGQGNNGTLTKGPARVSGKIGQGLEFGAVDNFVQILDASSFAFGTASFTVTAWIKTSYTGAVQIIFYKGPAGSPGSDSTLSFYILTTGELQARIRDASAPSHTGTISNRKVNDGAWHHVVMLVDRSSQVVDAYIDGTRENVNSDISAEGSVTNAGNIGIGSTDGIWNFKGVIDDVRIYNRALSADEIKRLYKIGATTKIGVSRKDTLTDGLVGYWTFDGPDVEGTTAYDRSGQGNNGTLTKGPVRAAGKIGQGMSFDGVNDQVDFSSISSLTKATFSVWVYKNSYSSNIETIIGTTNQNSSIVSVYDDGSDNDMDVRFDTNSGSGLTWFNIGFDKVQGSWYHLAVTWDETTDQGELFINGQSQGVKIDSINEESLTPANSGPNVLGRNFGSVFFNGTLDDVRIYNRALSADEIMRLYKMGK